MAALYLLRARNLRSQKKETSMPTETKTVNYITYKFTASEWNFIMNLASIGMPFPTAADFVKRLRITKHHATFKVASDMFFTR